jgi:hypothetical protein
MIAFLPDQREEIRGRGRARRRLALALAAAALGLAGCSVSIPLPSFIDDEPTGSIKPRDGATTLSSAYDSRDWRVAEPILTATLRAKEGGEPGAWTNPETGARGEFVAVAGPFLREGRSCRAFLARIVGKDQTPEKTLQAVGCPSGSGEVAIYDASPWMGL